MTISNKSIENITHFINHSITNKKYKDKSKNNPNTTRAGIPMPSGWRARRGGAGDAA